MRSVFVIVMVALAALFVHPPQASGQVFYMENPNVGKEAQNFTLNVLDGGEASFDDFREGKKAIVFFWATWCPHCRTALNELVRRKQEIDSLDIKVVLVDVGEAREIVQKYFEKNNIDMDVFLDEATEISETYGVIGIPTFYFVGEDGIIRKVQNSFPQDFENPFYGS